MKLKQIFYIYLILLCSYVTVNAINFSPASDINNNPTKTANNPQIALNSTGTAIAVWGESVGSVNNVFARIFDDTSWSVTDNLNTNTARNAGSPQIALNSTGTAIAVWGESVGSVNNVFARIFDGTSWSVTADNLNTNTARYASSPQIALNSTGTAIAVWTESVGSVNNVFARIFDDTSWSVTATPLNYDTAREASSPQIALNSTGTAIAVWKEYVGSVNNVFARTFDGTSWSVTTTPLNYDTAREANYPQIALNDDGTAIAVWSEYDGSVDNVFARTFDGTSWSTTDNLNTNTARNAYYPQIALNSTGAAIAVWKEYTGSVPNIFARTFDGTSWSVTTTPLNYDTAREANYPQIALNDDGTAIAVWMEDTGSVNNVFARTFDGTSWSATAYNLNNNTARLIQPYPQIALNDDGTAIAVWNEYVGSNYNIYVRNTVLPYYFTQWLSSWYGNKQYIAAATYNEKLNENCVDIYEFLPNNNGIDFKTSITFESTTTINSFAVYNKSDTELYLAILGTELLQIWNFNGSTATLDTDLSQTGQTYNDAQWLAPSDSQAYIAAIDNSNLTVFDLANSSNNATIGASGNKLLWILQGSYRGVAVVDTNSVTPYQVDYSTNPITITAGTGYDAPTGFEFESISTCGDYIVVGLKSTDTTAYGYAQIRILDLDSDNNTLSFSGTSTTLASQVAVPSLARCCCCSTLRPLLAGSYDINRNYSISVFAPDLSQLYASTLLGNNVSSVGWSCQDESIYLTAAGHENINGFLYTAKYTFSLDSNALVEQVVLNN